MRVIKIQLRLARLSNGLIMDRDIIGAINIGLRYFSSDGSPVALASTEPHGVWMKLLNPYQGLTPIKNKTREIIRSIMKGETLS